MHFQVVKSLKVPPLPQRVRKPKLQGALPPETPPRPPTYGEICFRATADIVDADTGAPHMRIKGYLPTPAVSTIVQEACEKVANTAQRCTDAELSVMRRNDSHTCEGLYYEIIEEKRR